MAGKSPTHFSGRAADLRLQTVLGQPSWRLASDRVELFVTRAGGHVAPVTFDRKNKRIQPYSIAPWAVEPQVQAELRKKGKTISRVLRGDFFCMPFGGNATPYNGEKYPSHGETANANWSCRALERAADRQTLHLSLRTRIRPGQVRKELTLIDGHDAVYTRHVVEQMAGPMSFGHHAMLKFPDEPGSGVISTSPFVRGQVYVQPVEKPENRGYSILKPGATFDRLDHVPTITGETADLSRYPARRGYEDLVMISADPKLPFAWTAVTFAKQGWAWLALKDPRVLASTIFWISNGGRHYSPWLGRHVNVLGLEEVTSWFHPGLAESVKPNDWSKAGIATHVKLQPNKPMTVNYITSAFAIPRGFDAVAAVIPADSGDKVAVISRSGKRVSLRLDFSFLAVAC